jgi:signal transduction histidine kinase
MVRVLKYNTAATLKIKNQTFELISCTNKQGDNSPNPLIVDYINQHSEMFCNPNIQLNPTNKQLEEIGLKYALSLPVFISGELNGLIVVLTQSDTAFMMLQDQIFLQRLSKQVTMGIQTIVLHDNKRISDKLIRQQNESLAQLIETRNQLFSIMAHDLRNPFSSLINMSSLLNDNFAQYDDDKKKLFINAINETATKALLLTDNLLEWGRMQQFDIESNKENININSLLKDSIEDILPNANQKQISISFKPVDDYKIIANPYMFRSACRNLLINSIKFTNNNGQIIISTRADEQYVYIEIEDNGIGISPETMTKLFKVEFKTTTQGTAGETGTGLGLLLCRDLIHRLSGTLNIKSELNRGTTVTITMPLATGNSSAITNKA